MFTPDALIGAAACCAGNACISLSYLLQKRAHNGAGGRRRLYCTATWLCGFFLMAPGELGNVLALRFVQPRLVAGFGALTVVFNAFGSARLLREHATRSTYVGAGLCACAGICFVAASSAAPPFDSVAELRAQLVRTRFMVYAFCLLSVSFFTALSTNLFSVVVSMGVYGAACLLTTNASVHLFRIVGVSDTARDGYVQWWLGAIALVFIVLQCIFFQRALAHHRVSSFIPAHYFAYNALSTAGAALLHGSFGAMDTWQVCVYAVGATAGTAGVVAVTARDRYECVGERELECVGERECEHGSDGKSDL